MVRALIAGILIFLAVLILRAPASLIQMLVPADAGIDLLDVSGTLWQGSGQLLVAGVAVGRIGWSFLPGRLMGGELGYDLSLTGGDLALQGQLHTGAAETGGTAGGQVEAAFANLWLAAYDIRLSGTFTLEDITFMVRRQKLTALSGAVHWNGGPVAYRLSGKLHHSTLPPLRGDLGPGPVAVVYPATESIPLLHVRLQEDGFLKIGVTRYLTRIVGDPWPGGDPDHAVVLEVEEQVF